MGFRIEFRETTTKFSRTDVAEEPELAASMSIREKMAVALRKGAMDLDELARQIDAKKESVDRVARRYKSQFAFLDSGKVGLCGRRL